MRVFTPRSLDEALEMLETESPPLTPVAGSTDLLVSWHDRPKDDLGLLDLSLLRGELGVCDLLPDTLELGALTSYWDMITDADVGAAFPLLAQAARAVGTVQIQTRGTWAGNIGNGSPAADGVLALMAYDARVVLRSRTGQRTVPLKAYYTGYRQSVRRTEELIVAVRVPRRVRAHEWFCKVGARRAQAVTKVGVAIVRDAYGWRVVANSVAPVVCRCPALEQALATRRRFRNPQEMRQLLEQDIAPIDDIRSTAEYRSNVLSRLLYHWLAETVAAGS